MHSTIAKPSPETPAERGRNAVSPWRIPLAGWKEIAGRTWRQTWIDNVGLVAAGVAFYGFLALIPLLGLIVMAYGLVAEPETVIGNMRALTDILPNNVALFIGEQLLGAIATAKETKGWGVLVALAFAFYGGSNGAGAIITALNIAYQEKEKRSLTRFYLIALVMTLLAVVFAMLALAATAAIASIEQFLPQASGVTVAASKAVAYLALLLIAAGIAATLYRFAPSREQARWEWITPGSLFTAVTWVLLTLGFGYYVTSVADYNATYGSLGAVIALLTWMYLSAYVFVIGAELNSEIEHQTAKDSTTGEPEPMGKRGAWAADNVAANVGAEAQVLESKDDKPSLGDAGPPVPTDEPDPTRSD
jgi:membrane protein